MGHGPAGCGARGKAAAFAGVKHCIACANGTDALMIVLRAWNVGPGDAVFVPAFTFAASAEVVALVGASPVFVDVLEDTFNMDPASLESAIVMTRRDGKLRPRVVMPVDLFGQPADYPALEAIAAREGLKMLCDTAQGFGGTLDGRRTGRSEMPPRQAFFLPSLLVVTATAGRRLQTTTAWTHSFVPFVFTGRAATSTRMFVSV